MKKIYLIILLLCFSAVYAALPASKIYEQKVNSVLYIETQSGSGSGIILKEDGTFVTCFHVISDADYINVKTKNGSTYKVNGYRYLNPDDDVAILTLSTTKKFTPITTNNKVNIGDNVYAIANPKGLQFVFSDGMINQLKKESIQFSAPTSPGSSGGALLNQNGELIGMITSQYNPSRAQNINFALPNSYFLPYIDKKKKVNTKKLSWTNFVTKSLNKKEFDIYTDYAIKHNNISMFYKYMKHFENIEDTPSEQYALLGALAVVSYLEMPSDISNIQDAIKWFALSIVCNKNIEVSSYGLIIASLINNDLEHMAVYDYYLKKYPRSKKHLMNVLYKLRNCNDNDDKCFATCFNSIELYLKALTEEIMDDEKNN